MSGLCAALLVGCTAAGGTTSTAGSSSGTTSAGPSGPSASGSAPSQDAAEQVRPGESWIVYQLYSGGSFHIRLIRPDGTGDHQLLPDSVPATQSHPDWSPDGSRIVYSLDGHELWTVGVDGTDLRRLPIPCDATCEALDAPAWSPDGRSIAFMRQDHPVGHDPFVRVQRLAIDTGAVTTLYTPPHSVGTSWLRWAPDARSLVLDLQTFPSIDSDVASGSAVATVDVTRPGAKARPLTPYAMFAAYPDWSPRGDRIVFSTYDLGVRDAGNFADMTPPSDLYTVRPDGTGLTQLTHNPSGSPLTRNGTASGPLSTQPTWSPDGGSIIFVQVDGPDWPGWQMATIRADGSGQAPAVATGYRIGTHPRLRPVRP